MNPIQSDKTFHNSLIEWSEATDLNTFATKVLDYPDDYSVVYSELARHVNRKVQRFAEKYKDRLFSIDRPSLEKIEKMLSSSNNTSSVNEEHIILLKSIFKEMLEASHKPTAYSQLPSVIQSICHDYSSDLECIKLLISEMSDPSKQVKNWISNLSPAQCFKLINMAKSIQTSDPLFFEKIISLFFEHASPENQNYFFTSLGSGDDKFLDKVIPVIPKSLSTLNLVHCKCLLNRHLIQFIEQLPHLKSLTFAQANFRLSFQSTHALSQASIHAISRMAHLQKLSLSLANNSKLTHEICNLLLQIPTLRHLKLSHCTLTKQSLITAINLPDLVSLNLSDNINFDNDVARAITLENSQLERLNVTNCPFLTREGLYTIVDKLKNLTEFQHDFIDPETSRTIKNRLQKRKKGQEEREIAASNKKPKLS